MIGLMIVLLHQKPSDIWLELLHNALSMHTDVQLHCGTEVDSSVIATAEVIISSKPDRRPEQRDAPAFDRIVYDADEAIEGAEIVVIALSGSLETEGLIDARQLIAGIATPSMEQSRRRHASRLRRSTTWCSRLILRATPGVRRCVPRTRPLRTCSVTCATEACCTRPTLPPRTSRVISASGRR